MATVPLDMVVAGVGNKTWSIPGKADVEGRFVKGEAFIQQVLLQMFLWARPRSMRARPSCNNCCIGLFNLIVKIAPYTEERPFNA
jgi:hypothetical protein